MGVRNIFDQYSQYENKLTHALISSLENDRDFLKKFLDFFVKIKIDNTNHLALHEQSLPFKISKQEERGLPDALIIIDSKRVICLENKIEDKLTIDQLERHYKTILSNDDIETLEFIGVTFTPNQQDIQTKYWKHFSWKDLYSFLQNLKGSFWVKELMQYMEVLERKMIDDKKLEDIQLTQFTGIPFNKENSFDEFEARRTLKLLMPELKRQKILDEELDLNLSHLGRGKIKKGESAWDIIPVKDPKEINFSNLIHFSIVIAEKSLDINFVIPDKLKGRYRTNLKKIGYETFRQKIWELINKIDKALEGHEGYYPSCDMVQRRYSSINARAVLDSNLKFNLRTAFPRSDEESSPCYQEQWLKSIFESLVNKGTANIQVSFQISFDYDECDYLNDSNLIHLIVKSLLSFKDFYNWFQLNK